MTMRAPHAAHLDYISPLPRLGGPQLGTPPTTPTRPHYPSPHATSTPDHQHTYTALSPESPSLTTRVLDPPSPSDTPHRTAQYITTPRTTLHHTHSHSTTPRLAPPSAVGRHWDTRRESTLAPNPMAQGKRRCVSRDSISTGARPGRRARLWARGLDLRKVVN